MAKEREEIKGLIAARLRAARESSGLSQGQVSKKLKMHRPTISEIEAGRRNVTSEEMGHFANLYNVEVWWLSGADPEEKQDVAMARYEVAARHLSKMKEKDFDNLMKLLSTLKRPGGATDDSI